MPPSDCSYAIGVISDTHGYMPNAIFEIFAGVDLILHAGDIGRDDLLMELETIAPVRAVSGNVDGVPVAARRPLYQQLETPAGRIAMTHGHLAHCSSLDCASMLHHFREFHPGIIIYGHSHIPLLRREGDVWLFNPGSAGRGRFGRGPSVGLIRVAAPGAEPTLELIPLTAEK